MGRHWASEGMPTRTADGERRVVPHEGIAWLLEREFARGRSSVSTPDEAAQRARDVRLRADLRELELGQRRGQLVAISVYQECLERFVGGFMAVASGQLQRFEREIVSASTPADARKITMALHRALTEGAQSYADRIEAEAEADKDASEGGEAA
jgi:hypothetical protein